MMAERVTHPELSRPYFEREMRVGRRVIFQWDPVQRFGKDECPECEFMGNADGKIIEGFLFVDERRAAAFDIDFIRLGEPDDEESITRFQTWTDAEQWVHLP